MTETFNRQFILVSRLNPNVLHADIFVLRWPRDGVGVLFD